MRLFYFCTLLLLYFLFPAFAWAVVDPVGWWKLDAGTGTTAVDSGSGGNSGTLINTPTWVSGHIGANALSFAAASSQYVTVGNPSAVQITGNITLSAWVNPTTLPTVNGTFFFIAGKGYDSGSSPDTEGYLLRFTQNFGIPTLQCGSYENGNNHIVSWDYGGSITTGNWYHLACRFDGSTWKIYSNGTEQVSVTDSTGAQANDEAFLIGAESIDGSPARYFNGIIDDVRLYNRALTPTEITDMANQTEGTVGVVRRRSVIVQ